MQPLEPRRAGAPSHASRPAAIPSRPIFRASAIPQASLTTPSTFFRDCLISLLLFLLISEWLRPLAWMADADIQTGPILVVFGICIAIDCCKVPLVWAWMSKVVVIVLFIGFMFDRNGFLSGAWVIDLVSMLSQDIGHLARAHFDLISGQLRTLLFLLGWSLLISVVQALMLQRQHSLWFVGTTLIYLVLLQLMLGADTVPGIMRTIGYGLFLLALLNLSRIEQTYGFASVRPGSFFQWLAVSFVFVAALAGAGWFSAKQAEPTHLMKPVSWGYLYDRMFELYNGDMAASTAIAKSGYGQDDSSLGGPLQVDTTTVFTAKTSELTYWRGESKNVYDGKGWTQTSVTPEPLRSNEAAGTNRVITQEVLWSDKSPSKQLFLGGKLQGIDMLLTEKGKPLSPDFLLVSAASGKISLPEIMDSLSYYKVTVQPVQVDPILLSTDTTSYPAGLASEYLQLPASLPRTVRSLAEQVTASSPTPFAKAVAIEQYLSHTYPYSLGKSTHPSRNEDFVSHFLFVDQTGYCDHFSTSMVVMLRSVGVSARWVKGFAPGTLLKGSEDEQLKEVAVGNQDAHSWVEVYFPSAGWVPFEPTPGFSGMSSDNPQEILTTEAMARSEMTASLANITKPNRFTANPREWLQTTKETLIHIANRYQQVFMILIGCCFLFAGLVLLLRRKGYLYAGRLHVPFYINRPSDSHPLIPYMDRLWMQLFRKYGLKSKDQTIREYIGALKSLRPAQQQALLSFAQIYESVRYDSAHSLPYSKREITAIWKAIQKTH
ncbi:transglutaminase-like domain-containing protein [Paenibacillus sp. HWE-109]|uniref:transglutaminase-like domain-containing protein n=1 Tax=Paenibacillus sp. HWE-109 TaxID=1306526 RepID=UPI001EDE4931|nr:transglutaminase-like domain-containing protein [Paenibacillus sp. HWE-109]UKS26530.1 transglutaminase-like domain-containing protein [Paenibacillus sp. HWE-109]